MGSPAAALRNYDQNMPYITKDKRKLKKPTNVGELNYHITKLVCAYLGTQPDYSKFNDAVGALEAAKLELYRRLIAPYENKKILENGDVYS